MKTFDLYWSPEGRKIATVQAPISWEARKKAPPPYCKAIKEIYAVERAPVATLQELIDEASATAKARNHDMVCEVKHDNDVAIYNCTRCSDYFIAKLRPAYNDTQISGPALATNCRDHHNSIYGKR